MKLKHPIIIELKLTLDIENNIKNCKQYQKLKIILIIENAYKVKYQNQFYPKSPPENPLLLLLFLRLKQPQFIPLGRPVDLICGRGIPFNGFQGLGPPLALGSQTGTSSSESGPESYPCGPPRPYGLEFGGRFRL